MSTRLFCFVGALLLILVQACSGGGSSPGGATAASTVEPSPTPAISESTRLRAADLIWGLRQEAECSAGNLDLIREQGVWRTSCDKGNDAILLACDMLEKQLIPSQAPSYGELQPPMLDFCRRAIALMRDEPARTAGPKFGPLADEIEAFIAQ